MCGIVGYIGPRDAAEVIIEGLKKLEYRGYDSSGLAVLSKGKIELRRSVGKIEKLVEKVAKNPVSGHVGIGHTRWATHGRPTEENAHPHVEGGVAVVHNGIIENYIPLREELKKDGAKFKSETDTEILAHLIGREVKNGSKLEDAVRAALKRVKGTYAIAVASKNEPDKLVAAKMECPLVVGIGGVGDKEAIISSDVLAIIGITRRAIFLDDGEMCVVTRSQVTVSTIDGKDVSKSPKVIEWSPVAAEKGGYRHFMLKEIFEQPRAITDTFRGLVMEEEGDIFFNEFGVNLKSVRRICVVACGTSWHAALIGKFLIEEWTGLPVEVDYASEFRYRNPVADKKTLVIAVSQSGETADTVAAIKESKRREARTLAICNVTDSSLTREADWTLYTHAGPEIGVASTKTFTAQIAALYMLALYIGRRTGAIDRAKGMELVHELRKTPARIERVLREEKAIKKIANKYFRARDFLFLARGINYPVALEGALKLKELSYIHAEGYPAGEMKHGPIALIDEFMPVVFLAPMDAHYPKVVANMEEVKARGGRIIAFVSEGDTEASAKADDVVVLQHAPHYLMPLVLSVPMQLLAYHMAVLRGTDVDQPRNLAKSVTVE
ncbi:MAG TPA: glutamine--fructose-6-phosphate transaminase (isomerizing) [Thermodesulfobacteriota bacterium]|nr:glutamine--fructose-6-phosphate transaminase (isomerizing) [Thermodesulfobacteriota bacterium]